MLRDTRTAPLEGDYTYQAIQDIMPSVDENTPAPDAEAAAFQKTHEFWIKRVRDAFNASTNYLEQGFVNQWEKNRSLFENSHPAGSKYHTDAYKFRSRIFRPKIRAAESKGEAAYAEAMFGSSEIINVEPVDQSSKDDAVMAEIWEAILNWRIKKDIKWYLISVGAFQATWINGIAISRQDWDYRDEAFEVPDGYDAEGNAMTRTERRVKWSKPRITLIEPQNFRFAPGADWTDPIGSSPYLIEIIPIYIDDLMLFMQESTTKGGQSAWIGVTRDEVLKANKGYEVTTWKTEREKAEDIVVNSGSSGSFQTIWMHRNIVKDDSGVDHEFYTVGTDFMLSWPVPLNSPVGRNYVVGVSNIEVFKAIPAGRVQLAEGLQAEANDLVNQQLDNVKLALNRGYLVKRSTNVDLNTLRRSYPGRVIMTDDLNGIREERVSDVTSSSYAQQDRINNDMDDIVGGFSQGSVATNANLNRTVGGMQMLQNSSNAVTGYIVRTFVETWVEPVLGQILRLTQEYEEESVINKFVGDKEIKISTDQILKSMSVVVSVGFGNLDPKLRAQTMVSSFQTAMAVAPTIAQKIDDEAILCELASVAGYRDGRRFLLTDEQVQQRMQEAAQQHEAVGQDVQQAQQQAAEMNQMRMQLEQQRLELEAQKIQLDAQHKQQQLQLERELGIARIAAQENVTVKQLEQRLGIDLARIDLAEREHKLKIAQIMNNREDLKRDREEMMLKERMGSGI